MYNYVAENKSRVLLLLHYRYHITIFCVLILLLISDANEFDKALKAVIENKYKTIHI